MPTRQRYLAETVLEAARRRMAFIFDHHETVICSISGGKDSTVMAHLALLEARRRQRKVGLFFLDEEAMYQASVDQVEYLMDLYPEATNRLWLQVPFHLTNATSLTEGQLIAWEPGRHRLWMRSKGQDNIIARPWGPNPTVRNRAKGFGFYDVIDNFEACYEGAAFLVGLRAAGESPNRWRAVVKNPVEIGGRPIYWATSRGRNTVAYPIYDWNVHDVWKYIDQEGLRYNAVYDWQLKKGIPRGEMRVSSLIHERSFRSLCELPEFEPRTYERLMRRVKGIALAQETGKDAALFRCRKLPKAYSTWRAYRDFLLATHPDPSKRPIFERRFSRQLDNEYVARQQCRQLVCNDYENNLAVENRPDPREELIDYYRRVL